MYKYETHLHTVITSKCSRFTPQEIVEKYVRLGYAGVFVTDHFMRGNCRVSRDLPWEEQVARYCDGYRAVLEAAEGKLDVFFGFEISHYGTDFLVYGLGEEWIKKHPELMTLPVNDFCDLMREAGGLVIQAHPYREAEYIDHIRLYPTKVEGVEVINAANGNERTKFLSRALAKAYGLRESAGSDIHGNGQSLLAGLEFEERLTSVPDFTARFLNGEGRIFTMEDKGVL